jgi:hypothetical protein
MSYELVPDEALEGELLDAVQDCDGGYRECTNTNVELVEDPYESDVNDTPGQMRWLCPECLQQLVWDI